MKLTKGQLVNVTNGEYSDYYLMGAFRVLKDFDSNDTLAEFAKEHNIERKVLSRKYDGDLIYYKDDSYKIGPQDYLAWLNKGGYLEDADIVELYLGSYNQLHVSK